MGFWDAVQLSIVCQMAGILLIRVLLRFATSSKLNSTAAGDRLIAAQNAAQSQTGNTLFLRLIQEEVIFT